MTFAGAIDRSGQSRRNKGQGFTRSNDKKKEKPLRQRKYEYNRREKEGQCTEKKEVKRMTASGS